MPKVQRIKIKKGYPNGTMDLSDNENTNAWKGDLIVWTINKNAGVASIKKIVLKEGTTDVFLNPPHANGSDWSAEIRNTVARGETCSYTIHWIDMDGNEKIFDPIITIKPTFFSREFGFVESAIVFTLGAISMAIASFVYFKFRK